MPIFCHADLLEDHWLQFHKDAGLPIARNPLPYQSDDEFNKQLAYFGRHAGSLILDYLHPPGEIPESAYWVKRSLIASLNNKANLEKWSVSVPTPNRQVVSYQSLVRNPESFCKNGRPVYIKGVSDGPSGGGFGVRYAKTPQVVEDQARELSSSSSSEFVIEEARPYTTTFCLNYIIHSPCNIKYIGAGEQLIKEHTAYIGSWFDPDSQPSAEAVNDGMRIAQRAAQAGYIGFAGMDVGVLANHGWEFIDLNFRINGSTPALLFLPGIRQHLKTNHVAQLCVFTPSSIPPESLLFLLQEMDLNHLFILSAFAPREPNSGTPRIKVIILGDDRQQVARRKQLVKTALSP